MGMDKPNFVELGSTDPESHAMLQVIVDPDQTVEVRILGDDHRWAHIEVDLPQLFRALGQIAPKPLGTPGAVVRLAPRETV
jgi:hypothetical protein